MKCIKCGKETNNRKFCSRSCSVSITNLGRNRSEDNRFKYPPKVCLNCTNDVKRGRRYSFCSKDCETDFKKKERYAHIENGTSKLKSAAIKRYLIEKFGNKCMRCGWAEINPYTNKIPVELEHIDGNSDNNELSNVELLCPNHHSLTKTYKALNVGNGRHSRRERYRAGKSV